MNPLSTFTDKQIAAMAIYLHMICGRSKVPTKGKGKAYLCGLATQVDVELGQRGLPTPVAPFLAPSNPPAL